MKRLLPFLMLVLFIQPADAVVFISGTSGAGACSTSISDDFSGTLTLWSDLGTSGSWTINSGQVEVTVRSVLLYTDEQTCVAGTQWAMAKVDLSQDNVYGGFYFRSQNDQTTYAYAVRYEEPNVLFRWRYCGGTANSNTASSCISLGTWTRTLDNNDYYGVEITGTGDATEVKIYDLGTTAINYSNWASSADSMTTLTDNPGVYAADTGKYIGLYDGAGNIVGFDDFSGGSE